MVDKQGDLKTERQDIADVFADFYSDLYFGDMRECLFANNKQRCEETVPAITATELVIQLKKMKKRKSCDSCGVVAEMLKCAGSGALSVVAEMFTELLKPSVVIPAYWKETRLKVLYKKGHPALPDNYSNALQAIQ